jgi:hypothetical protein
VDAAAATAISTASTDDGRSRVARDHTVADRVASGLDTHDEILGATGSGPQSYPILGVKLYGASATRDPPHEG